MKKFRRSAFWMARERNIILEFGMASVIQFGACPFEIMEDKIACMNYIKESTKRKLKR